MAHLVKMLAYLARKSQSYFDSFVIVLTLSTWVSKLNSDVFNQAGATIIKMLGLTNSCKLEVTLLALPGIQNI